MKNKTIIALSILILATISCKLFQPGLGTKVDITAPVLSITSPTNGEYVGGMVTVSGTYNEDTGVKSITVTRDGGDTIEAATIDTAANTWSFTFDSTLKPDGITPNADGEINVLVQITDIDDKITNQSVLLRVDNTAPMLLVKNPQYYDSTVFNGDIAINGDAYDTFGIASVEIEFYDPDDISSTTEVFTAAGTNSWSYNFESNLYVTESGNYVFEIRATDMAGNQSSYMYHYNDVLTRNGGSITINNMYNILNGISYDGEDEDDLELSDLDPLSGTTLAITEMEIEIDQTLDVPEFIISNPDSETPADENILAGSANALGMVIDDDGVEPGTIMICLDPADTLDPDDPGNVWIPVDEENGSGLSIRWEHSLSGLSDGSHVLMISGEDILGHKGYSVPVGFIIDSGAPTVEVTSPSQGDYISGNFTITGTATDDGSVASVEVSLNNGVDYNPASLIGDDWTYDVVVSADATMKIKVKATDNIGSASYYNLLVISDSTPPVITFVTPVSATTVNGEVTFRGTASDNNQLDTDIGVTLTIDKAAVDLPADGDYNWDFTLNSIDYANAIFADDMGGNIWRLDIRAVVTDVAGNTGQTSGYYILINNDLDKPTVNILSPTEGKIIGGPVLIAGTAFDDDLVHHVEMQIDINGDGDFLDAIDIYDGSSSTLDGDTNDKFEDETQWYTVDGTSTWTEYLNNYGEFYETEPGHDGDITIRVRAVDTKNTITPDLAGEYEELNIIFDDTLPHVENLNLASYDYVSGTFTLTGDIFDDQEISNIWISYNNGANYTDITSNPAAVTENAVNDYSLHLDIDSSTYVPTSGILQLKLRIEDDANYQTITGLYLNVDNIYPTGTWDSGSVDPEEIEGSTALVQGTAEDSGTVSGFEAAHVYFTRGATLLDPNGGGVGTLGTQDFNDGSDPGTITSFPYPDSAADIIIIDNEIEFGNDGGGNGDGDGYDETITLAGSTYTWSAEFNSNNISDGALIIHYVIFDPSGNGTHYEIPGFIKNHRPVINALTIGTDLDFSTSVEADEQDTYVPATSPSVRQLLYVLIDADDPDGGSIASWEVRRQSDDTALLPDSLDPDDYGSIGGEIAVDGETEGSTLALYALITDDDGITARQNFSVVIDNDDSIDPEIDFYAITDDNVVSGHVEASGESSYNNSTGTVLADADVSGLIELRGQLRDDQRIQNLYLAIDGYTFGGAVAAGNPYLIATWAGNELTSQVGADLYLDPDWDVTDGHTVDFIYSWNSADISNSVGNDILITFTAEDFGSTTSDATANTEVDVVPYITDLEIGLESGTLSYLQRSAQGAYPIAASNSAADTFLINGYNLNMASGGVTIGADGLTVEDYDSTEYLWIEARKDSSVSGDLTVTVNSIDSINNTNNNLLSQNSEATTYYPDMADDRYLSVWGVADQGVSSVTEAVMRPNTARTDMDWMYVENSQYLRLNGTRISYSWTLAGGDFMRNSDGKLSYIFLHDMNWSSGNDNWDRHGSVQWGMLQNDDTMTDLGQDYAFYWNQNNSNRLGIGNLSWDSDADYSPNTKMMSRYSDLTYRLGPGSDNTDSDVYAVYYDKMSGAQGIVFWAFEVGTGVTQTTQLDTEGATYYATLTKTVNDTNNYDTGTHNDVGIKTPANRVVVTGSGSEHLDMQIDPTSGYAYIVYYDQAAAELKFAYNTTPMAAPSAWTIRTTAIDSQAGRDVSMTVDASGGIHLVYFDGARSNLKYAYLPAYNCADGLVETYTVDALFTNGMQNSIAIRDFSGGAGTDYRPIISSFSLSYSGTPYALRVSWPTASIGSISDGANEISGAYTGDWEVMTVPAGSAPSDSPSYIETDGAIYQGQIIIGYNADSLEEATLYSE